MTAQRPTLYGAFAHVWLREFWQRTGRRLTLAEIPDEELDRLQDLGFDWIWLIGVWQTGPHGRTHAVTHPELRAQCKRILPDLRTEDMVGSPYAVHEYKVHKALGGDAALLALRERLERRDIRLMLDFVPNHVACDHPWTKTHPDYFVQGRYEDIERKHGFFVESDEGDRILLHGKDPYFEPWADTVQLDWRNPEAVRALVAQVEHLTTLCDGLRCDMAMLVLNDVFRRTWGDGDWSPPAFEPWNEIVRAARSHAAHFTFLAEVYWNREEELIDLGFNWVYDKVLYDRLRYDPADNVRAHLKGMDPIQELAMRFLENHDEPRAASSFSRERQQASAVIASTLPGPFFVHYGQMEGRRQKLPIQLGRAPVETVDEGLVAFYGRLLEHARAVGGTWRRFDVRPAWEGSETWNNFVAHGWSEGTEQLVVAVNLSGERSQGYVDLSHIHLSDRPLELTDVLTGERYQREPKKLRQQGLYVELPPWGSHLFRFLA